MKNRLRMHWRVVLGFCSVFFFLTLPGLYAQQGFFNFTYPGPNTIIVDPATCSNTLAGNIGTPTVTSTNGHTIITSEFSPDSSNFLLTDPWTFDEVAQVYWYVADNAGHSHYFSFFITFVDTTAPVIVTAGTPATVQYASVSQVPAAPNLTAVDSCSSSLNVMLTESMRPPLCSSGVFTRTWLATDNSGNTGVFTQTITILIDTLPPTVLTAPQNGSASCTETGTAYPNWLATQMTNFTATDPSGVAGYTNNAPPSITGSCPAPLTVIFTATDSCGRSVARTATFTTIDDEGPDILRAPQDSVAACSPPADNHFGALSDWIQRRAGLIVKDSCTPDNEILYSMQINGLAVDSAQIVAAFMDSLGIGCGSQTLGGQMYPKVRGTIGVDFFSQDACGNITYAGHGRFGAIDTIAPVLSGNMVSEECGGGNDSTALSNWINNHGNATGTDDCSGFSWTDFSWLTSSGQSGTGLFNAGPYPVIEVNNCTWYVDITFRATDDCGNTGSTTLRFQITDTTPPVFSALPTDTLYCPNTTAPQPTAFVSDNCDSDVLLASNFTQTNQICSDSYTLLYTWIATDDCGNTSTATQTFIVLDTTKPVITLLPADITMRCDTFSLPPGPVLGEDFMATDVCGDVVELSFEDISGQNPDPGTCGHYTYDITRVFTVTDDCGNTGTGQQIIHIVDNIPPVISGFTDTTIVCEVQPITPLPTATDICTGIATGPILVDDIITGGDCDDSYTRTLSWESSDICGNTSAFTQNILVVDTVKPTLTGVPMDVFAECNNVPPLPANGTITGADNCDEEVDITFLETELRDPNPANCAHWTNYTIRREWTAMDNCGNSRTYTQMITVMDNTGPVMISLDTVKTPTAPGLCGANTVIPSLVSVFDDCTSLPDTIVLRDTVVLTPSGTPIDQVPVDTVVFSWAAPNVPPGTPVVGSAVLAIALDNADSELPSESFQIYGEDGYLIGRTKLTNVSCGNSGDTLFTLPASLLNGWLTDGVLEITLAPNGSGPNACNAFCPGGRARARLTYGIATPQLPVTINYSVDNGPVMPYPPPGSIFLDAGDHIVTYEAADCAGNSSTATTILRIEDLEPPALTPPAAITAYVGAADCISSIALPFPAIQENCGFPADISKTSGVVPVQFEQDPNAGWVPKNAILNVSGIIPNAVTDGVLKIRHVGDNGNAGEFFRVSDETGTFLSTTTIAASGECVQVHETTIPVTAGQINAWAVNGVASFLLEANRDVVNYSDFINPCGALNAGNFDGISTVEAVLMYNLAEVEYEIKKVGQSLPIQAGQLNGSQTSVSLSPGNYTTTYRVQDISGNIGTAGFSITILDTIPPDALCQPITIFTNPSGTVNYTLQPQQINAGSMDNCSGTNLSFLLSQTTFTCNMATPPNNIYPVTLTVTDTSGNSSTCTSSVQVQTVSASPTVTPGVCEGGSVQLFANPPAPNPGYTYMWTGPAGFSSNQPNPIIPSTTSANEGTYTVKVTGPTGCMTTGTVLLDLTNLPNQPAFQNVPSSICQGNTLTLTVQQFAGSVVTYSWYSGTPANPVLLGTTTIPMFQIPGLAPGDYQFYMKVAADGCTSLPTDIISVEVIARPDAPVDNANISVCSCEVVTLGTPAQGPGITYAWSGPSGYSSTAQYPLVTTCAQPSQHAGTYTLIVSKNGCASLPATVQLQVRPKPPKPVISGITSVCEGDTIQLTCNNVPTASQYYWLAQFTPKDTTQINTLIIPNASPADSGLWVLQVMQNNCLSDFSDGKLVQVQAFPNISASSNSPICQGATLKLSANSTSSGITYEWSGPNGFSKIGDTVSTNMPATGIYRVTASTGFGCTKVATVPVSVIVPPEITSVTNTAPDCADCATDALLQATIFTQNGPLTYSWTGGPGGSFVSSLPQPVIPNVCTADNGTYNLTVRDASNCISNQGSTTINVQAQPPTPQLGSDQTLCVGSPLSISVLNANVYGSNVLFEWHTPNGTIPQAQSKLIIPITGLQHDGDYFLVVKSGDCASAQSQIVSVTVNPIPPAPTVSSNTPVCAGDTLRLFANTIPNASYSWMGPSGFTASVEDPFIAQVNKATHEGNYFVKVTVAGCESPQSENTFVQIRSKPAAPTILPVLPACLDQVGASLTFNIAPATATPGAQYVWYYETDMAPISPPGFPLNYTLTNLSGLMPGVNKFYVRAMLNGCQSANSTSVSVTLDTIPNVTAFAGTDMLACDSFPFRLKATTPMPTGIATGVWNQISGPPVTIVNPLQDSTQVVGSISGNVYKYVWTLSSGSCKNFSRDTVQITVNKFENAMVEQDLIKLCFSDSVQLHAFQGQSISGKWTQPVAQTHFTPPIIINEPNNPDTYVSNLPDNATNLLFFWTLSVPGCPVDSAQVTVHTIGRIPFAGQDQNLCITDSCALLVATSLEPFETGKWTYLDSLQNPTAVISSPGQPTTIVCDLQYGANRFKWETNGGLCGNLSRDTVVVYYDLEPSAFEDSIIVGFGQQVEFDVLQNDIVPPQFTITVLESPKHGTWSEPSKGTFTYLPNLTFAGTDKLIYELCNLNPACPCSMSTLFFHVQEAGECRIPTIITPNGDGANDIFVVPSYCLNNGEEIPNNEVTIFNQWGDQVFHAQPYNNDWEGTFNGQPLPAGTYYFVVKLPAESKPRTGFLIIQR